MSTAVSSSSSSSSSAQYFPWDSTISGFTYNFNNEVTALQTSLETELKHSHEHAYTLLSTGIPKFQIFCSLFFQQFRELQSYWLTNNSSMQEEHSKEEDTQNQKNQKTFRALHEFKTLFIPECSSFPPTVLPYIGMDVSEVHKKFHLVIGAISSYVTEWFQNLRKRIVDIKRKENRGETTILEMTSFLGRIDGLNNRLKPSVDVLRVTRIVSVASAPSINLEMLEKVCETAKEQPYDLNSNGGVLLEAAILYSANHVYKLIEAGLEVNYTHIMRCVLKICELKSQVSETNQLLQKLFPLSFLTKQETGELVSRLSAQNIAPGECELNILRFLITSGMAPPAPVLMGYHPSFYAELLFHGSPEADLSNLEGISSDRLTVYHEASRIRALVTLNHFFIDSHIKRHELHAAFIKLDYQIPNVIIKMICSFFPNNITDISSEARSLLYTRCREYEERNAATMPISISSSSQPIFASDSITIATSTRRGRKRPATAAEAHAIS